MAKGKSNGIPIYHSVTEFLKGQASRIFSEVNEKDEIVIVNKRNKPQAVIISYDRYIRLKEEKDSDI
ncbi:MAG: type II toxin-antitoxin system Phd/YefM family antitoxin [Dysgonamonadaceae bacterium]|nr:type II toxin-antitoxin system Phd/YefM family antitoxin [Dysgonamonadaceae bacterium]MDD4729448.1 type II toxin-antitoxin system Phd/YefM family antitoxin [Dysgonamonadaceae bacterium]